MITLDPKRLAFVSLTFYLVDQHAFCPSILFCHLDIKLLLQIIFTFLKNRNIVTPSNFSHHWCKYCITLIFKIEPSNSPEVLR